MRGCCVIVALTGLAGGVCGQDCIPDDTTGDNFIVFEGALRTVVLDRLNPYDSSAPPLVINDERNVSTVCYDGGEGQDILFMTNLGDALLLLDEFGMSLEFVSVENVIGGDGDDLVILADATTAMGDLSVFSGDGNEIVWSNIGHDFIDGDAGDDYIHGGPGDDRIEGGDDNDVIYGGAGDDELRGDAGDDLVVGGPGDDRLFDGLGDNTYLFEPGFGIDCLILPLNGVSSHRLVFGTGVGVHDVIAEFFANAIDAGGCEPVEAVRLSVGTDAIVVITDIPADVSSIAVEFDDGRVFSAVDFPSPCAADTNLDGVVDPADFNAWVIAFNADAPGCDQNSDGLCTPADFNAWVLNFNAGCP